MTTNSSAKLDSLMKKIGEARDLLSELEIESERVIQIHQHNEIDHLEEHLDGSEFHLNNLTAFKDEVLLEIRELLEKLKKMR